MKKSLLLAAISVVVLSLPVIGAVAEKPVAKLEVMPVADQIKVDKATDEAKKAAEKRAAFEKKKRDYIEGMRKAERASKVGKDNQEKKDVPTK